MRDGPEALLADLSARRCAWTRERTCPGWRSHLDDEVAFLELRAGARPRKKREDNRQARPCRAGPERPGTHPGWGRSGSSRTRWVDAPSSQVRKALASFAAPLRVAPEGEERAGGHRQGDSERRERRQEYRDPRAARRASPVMPAHPVSTGMKTSASDERRVDDRAPDLHRGLQHHPGTRSAERPPPDSAGGDGRCSRRR